ncbi:hypothetical protein Barb4_01493 [Bacteroidales bacterium Barb4]|nr:hypothetical protein Barb4_01493 [Bacteroidales bacterium Barb4]
MRKNLKNESTGNDTPDIDIITFNGVDNCLLFEVYTAGIRSAQGLNIIALANANGTCISRESLDGINQIVMVSAGGKWYFEFIADIINNFVNIIHCFVRNNNDVSAHSSLKSTPKRSDNLFSNFSENSSKVYPIGTPFSSSGISDCCWGGLAILYAATGSLTVSLVSAEGIL